MDVYTTGYQESHALCTLRLFFLSEEGSMGVCVLVGRGGGECWLSIVIKPPSLYSHPPASTLLAPSFLSPAAAWNRLAPCQGERGLLWLCRKSARKNTNHLFRARPERGWGCKYRSLAPFAPCLLAAHTGPPSPTQELPLSLSLPQTSCIQTAKLKPD